MVELASLTPKFHPTFSQTKIWLDEAKTIPQGAVLPSGDAHVGVPSGEIRQQSGVPSCAAASAELATSARSQVRNAASFG